MYRTLIFLFLKSVVNSLRGKKLCSVMQHHQCEDLDSDVGAWYFFPSAVARQTCY